MTKKTPLISIIVPTYNRVHTIERAVESILTQTYNNFEIIIVDDGSIDDTLHILEQYHNNKRVRIIKHDKNRGVTAAKNTGFNHINGEWFTVLDSDDEMIKSALETMIRVPAELDGTIDAITCNCIDSVTGKFSGKGLYQDQYLYERRIILECSGEYWGLTSTKLLGRDRLNEDLPGYENTLWYKINERANRYYIHKGLRIYHTEGSDRITKRTFNIMKHANMYQALLGESHYMSKLKKYKPNEFTELCFKGTMLLVASNNTKAAQDYYTMLKSSDGYRNTYYKIVARLANFMGYRFTSLGVKLGMALR